MSFRQSSSTNKFSNKFSNKFFLCLMLASLGWLTADVQHRSFSQTSLDLPTPEEAIEQAEKMSSEEIAQIKINDAIRDKLRFDPGWQPLMQAVRQDIMEFKWNDGKLENPVWEQYAHRAYPLLSYYTKSNDYTRQKYGLAGIQALGKPFTTIWLADQLRNGGKDLGQLSFYKDIQPLIINELELEDFLDIFEEPRRDIKVTVEMMIDVASEKYDIENLPEFNRSFLELLKKYNLANSSSIEYEHSFDSNQRIGLPEWETYEPLSSLSSSRVTKLIDYFDSLTENEQAYVLAYKLGPIKAGEVSSPAKAVLKHVATDESSPYQVWAIADLDRHGDSESSQHIENFLNSDFTKISKMSTFADWEWDRVENERFSKLSNNNSINGTSGFRDHTYLLILGFFERFSNSKFTQACLEFGDLRGMSYLGRAPRSQEIQSRNAVKSPDEMVQAWHQWLNKYPGHPGEDDAMHFLARNLQKQGNTLEAIRQWLNLIVERPGDQDALEVAWLNVRTRLDVGLTVEQIELLIKEYDATDITPLLKYALAVHQARLQKYDEALTLTEEINLNNLPINILGSYYYTVGYDQEVVRQIQKGMQNFLAEQRERWKLLQILELEGTPASQYKIASNWSNPDGWKNGYLPFWPEVSHSYNHIQKRITILPFLNPIVCEYYWVCDSQLRSESQIVEIYRKANPNHVALSIYQDLIDSPDTSNEIKEKSLYMAAQVLLTQWELFPIQETIAIHPPIRGLGSYQISNFQTSRPAQELARKVKQDVNNQKYLHGELSLITLGDYLLDAGQTSLASDSEADFYSSTMHTIKIDYQRYINENISKLRSQFPESSYIDDLLLSSYFFTNSKSYLENIVDFYPESDRFPEAKFLLER